MKVTCIILHYWLERTKNIDIIVKALKEGTHKPDKIIVFNNNREVVLPDIEGVLVINSNTNYGGRARYPIALLEPSSHYLFLDDDTAPQQGTLANMVKYADNDHCIGYVGKLTHGKTYLESPTTFSQDITEPTTVDVLIGTGGILAPHSALLKMFKTEERLLQLGFEFGRDEDLVLSMSNPSKVIPAKSDEGLTELSTEGVGYYLQEGHNRRRNLVTQIMKKLLIDKKS